MKPRIVVADRHFAVRRAAAAWQRAGILPPGARDEIDHLYADHCVRTGRWFRLLYFVFTLAAGVAAFVLLGDALIAFELGVATWSVILLLLAAGLAAVTEALLGSSRLRRFGVEEATGWMALAAAGAAVVLALFEAVGLEGRLPTVIAALAVALCAALAAWRWGLPLTGAAAAAALFVALAPLPAGRWSWIAAAPLLAWSLERAAESPRVAPAHRSKAREGWWVSLAALYWAVHVGSVESGWWTFDRTTAGGTADGAAHLLSWSAMVLLPALLIVAGVATRRRARLDAGLLLAAGTAATIVVRLAPQPLWAVLLAGGLLLLGASLALRRLFRRAPERTLGGWTSDPLFGDAARAAELELVGVAAALSPEARELPTSPERRGGGGEFGGGGASSGF